MFRGAVHQCSNVGLESGVTRSNEPREDAIQCVAGHGDTIATGWCRGLSLTKAQLGSVVQADRIKAQVGLGQVQNTPGLNWVVSPKKEISVAASGCRILGHSSRCRVVGSIAGQFLVMTGGTPKSGRTKERPH